MMGIDLNDEARACAARIGLALNAGTPGNGLEGFVEKLVDMSPLSFIDFIIKRSAFLKPGTFGAIARFNQALIEREQEYRRNDLG